MRNKLLWKLCTFIGFGTVLLFLAIDWLTDYTETSMSFIDESYQQQLINYGKEAENILRTGGEAALAEYINALQEKEQTWVAVVNSSVTPLAGSSISDSFSEYYQLGRGVDWKIHLYFTENPVMEVPFQDKYTHFLIKLPERMRPGAMLTAVRLLLQIALPLVLLSVLSVLLYRHLMGPLRRLEDATKAFSSGQLEARVSPSLNNRDDELSRLAQTFDKMADRISDLIYNQKQLLADLSHELRTPLTRIDMAIDFVEQEITPQQAIERLRYEATTMRNLVEDTLTLAWLNTESPDLRTDNFDLVELTQVICDDARFEYPDHTLHCDFPEHAWIEHSSQLALGQAIENVIRNALRHTPGSGEVHVSLVSDDAHYTLVVADQGPGVPQEMLYDIFKPFFRVDKARRAVNAFTTKTRVGFGLGLALAERQVRAAGGSISAENITSEHQISGLSVQITLPIKGQETSHCV